MNIRLSLVREKGIVEPVNRQLMGAIGGSIDDVARTWSEDIGALDPTEWR